MSHPRRSSASFYAARAVNVALDLVNQHERRLVAILESPETTPERRHQALVDLACLTGILVRELAESEAAAFRVSASSMTGVSAVAPQSSNSVGGSTNDSLVIRPGHRVRRVHGVCARSADGPVKPMIPLLLIALSALCGLGVHLQMTLLHIKARGRNLEEQELDRCAEDCLMGTSERLQRSRLQRSECRSRILSAASRCGGI